MKDFAKKIIWTAIGQLISAISFCCILDANKLVGTGLGGFSMVLNRVFGWNMQVMLVAMALPIIIWAYFKYKKEQIFFAALNYFLFTFYTGIVPLFMPTFKSDLIVAAVAGGAVSGVASGIVMKQRTANGPEGIVAMYLKEKIGLSVGNFFLIMNSLIIFSSIVCGDLTLICYSIICTVVSSYVTDSVIVGTERFYIVNIMSDNYLEITEYIQKDLKRPVTFVQGLDTSNVKKKILMRAIVNKQELIEIKEFVKKYQDDSLIYATQSNSIMGRGFDVEA